MSNRKGREEPKKDADDSPEGPSTKRANVRLDPLPGEPMISGVRVEPIAPTSNPEQCEYMKDLSVNAVLKEGGLSLPHEYSWEEAQRLTHKDLIGLDIDRLGKRTKILAFIKRFLNQYASQSDGATSSNVRLTRLDEGDKEYGTLVDLMQGSIKKHENNVGGIFNEYNIISIETVTNDKVHARYAREQLNISEDNNGVVNERRRLFHGTVFLQSVLECGFDERFANIRSMFGAGIYFAENSSKSNLYIFGGPGSSCAKHGHKSCYVCERKLIVADVTLGRSSEQTVGIKLSHSPPDFHSVTGVPSDEDGGLKFPEYVIYKGSQALPTHVISYKIVEPK